MRHLTSLAGVNPRAGRHARKLSKLLLGGGLGLLLGFAFAGPAGAQVPPPFLLEWGGQGTGEGQFNGVTDVAVDSVDNVYAMDGNHRVQKFDSNGNFLRMWGFGVQDGSVVFQICTSSCQAGISGSGAGQFQGTDGLEVGPDGNIYVVDDQLGRVQVFDSSGNFLGQWPTGQSPALGSCVPFTCGNNPAGIGIDQTTGDVYVSLGASLTGGPYTVEKYDELGNLQTGWGTNGAIGNPTVNTAQGFLNRPIAVDVDSNGDVYVVDFQAPVCCFSRVQVFDGSTGAFLRQIGSTGTGDGQFQDANGIAIDSADNVYVTENGGDRVQKFTSAGVFLTKWGSFGSAQGQFNRPFGLAVDSSGNVYVADLLNHRIQKFGAAVFEVAAFDIERARVKLDKKPNRDRFSVRGSFEPDEVIGNGIDVLNEDVTVMFDGLSETIPAGSFFRDDDDEGFQFSGVPGGITQINIRDDGRFRVRARGLDLAEIDLTNPVFFSLQIGDDIGDTGIQFDNRGRFRQ